MKKFNELKKDIESKLMSELSDAIKSIGVSDSMKGTGTKVSFYGDRMANVEETSIIYLMKLTNDYIRAKRENNQGDIEFDLAIFKKYGFDATILDGKIDEIEYPYNANNEMWPNKTQEEIMQQVFNFFECPGQLPKVDDILETASKFGATYGNTEHFPGYSGDSEAFKIMWLQTRYFDDPYDTCKFFSTALNNGLTVEQIIESTNKLNIAMDYYDAPRGFGAFSNYSFGTKISSIVPFLAKDHERMSKMRALNVYKVLNRRLSNQVENTNEVDQTSIHR